MIRARNRRQRGSERNQHRSSIGVSRRPLHILVYSSNARTREQVRLALGNRIHPELPELTYTDVATGPW